MVWKLSIRLWSESTSILVFRFDLLIPWKSIFVPIWIELEVDGCFDLFSCKSFILSCFSTQRHFCLALVIVKFFSLLNQQIVFFWVWIRVQILFALDLTLFGTFCKEFRAYLITVLFDFWLDLNKRLNKIFSYFMEMLLIKVDEIVLFISISKHWCLNGYCVLNFQSFTELSADGLLFAHLDLENCTIFVVIWTFLA